jgi:hypothetical protein
MLTPPKGVLAATRALVAEAIVPPCVNSASSTANGASIHARENLGLRMRISTR